MLAQTYWNKIGSKKDFEDPFYLEKVQGLINKDMEIVEYGCGYGRLMQMLYEKGYQNVIGFDYSLEMIKRGKTSFPHLALNLLEESEKVPLKDESVGLVVMSTILCCIIEKDLQKKLIKEVLRILKVDGFLYLSDFLICDHSSYKDKYKAGLLEHREKGVYTTSEGLPVRHHSSKWIMELLNEFDVLWFEQFNFKTMNQNPATTFHCIVKKQKKA